MKKQTLEPMTTGPIALYHKGCFPPSIHMVMYGRTYHCLTLHQAHCIHSWLAEWIKAMEEEQARDIKGRTDDD